MPDVFFLCFPSSAERSVNMLKKKVHFRVNTVHTNFNPDIYN